MKRIVFIMMIFGLVLPTMAFAGDADIIINALKQGNAEVVCQYFDNMIDMKLPEKEEIKNVSKTQASITFRNFFEENKIKGFDLTSQREMSGTMYITGKLLGGAGKNYNITLMMKNKGDKLAIITVRINE